MKCRDCAEGRKFSAGSVYCVMYGMIIREGHECTLAGNREKEKDADVAAPAEPRKAEKAGPNEL